MGRVWAGFFDTRTRPTGLDLRPKPDPIINRFFFAGPKPTPSGPVQPLLPSIQKPNPIQSLNNNNNNNKLQLQKSQPQTVSITNINRNTNHTH